MTAKMSQKELAEPDKFQVAMQEALAYASTHKKMIIATSASIAVLILVVLGWFFYDRDYETSAMIFYNGISEKSMRNPAAVNQKQSIDGYKDLIEKYPRSKAAQFARYRLGNLYFQGGDIEKAISLYDSFIKKSSPRSDLTCLAYTGLGYCCEAKKDYQKALIYFEKALKVREGNPFEGTSERNIARTYEEMSERSKALEHYRKALEKTADPATKRLIDQKIAILS
jgi:tetratricopeptide (TPR) repeat protein